MTQYVDLSSHSQYAAEYLNTAIDTQLDDAGTPQILFSLSFTDVSYLFCRQQAGIIRFGNDLRELYRYGDTLDPAGIFSLLQFGALVPPFTLWQNIRRVRPGIDYLIGPDAMIVDHVKSNSAVSVALLETTYSDLESQTQCVVDKLDAVIQRFCPQGDPIILFSGGVDSGLLAARCAALGLDKTTLVNYSFGSGDSESQLAKAMAVHLGMEFVQIESSEIDVFTALKNAIEIYPVPFCDHSTLPTYGLVQAVQSRFGNQRVILNGVGADGAFGLFGKSDSWQVTYRIPESIRIFASHIYKISKLWQHNIALEHKLRILRRSVQLPMPATAIAQNSLHEIVYSFPSIVVDEVVEELLQWLHGVLPSNDMRVLYSGLDLALVCAGIFAQKDYWPFTSKNYQIRYPFLDPEIVALVHEHVYKWPANEKKQVLKHALSKMVPKEMVYRPKSGFVAPAGQIFHQPVFLDYYDRLFDKAAPLAPFLHIDQLDQLRHGLLRERRLPAQTLNCVWAMTFTNHWLNQLNRLASSRTL